MHYLSVLLYITYSSKGSGIKETTLYKYNYNNMSQIINSYLGVPIVQTSSKGWNEHKKMTDAKNAQDEGNFTQSSEFGNESKSLLFYNINN